MPIYHFHFDSDPDDQAPDVRILPSIEAARCEAAKTIGKMVCDAADGAWDDHEWGVKVTDDKGLILFWLSVHHGVAPAMMAAARPTLEG